MRAGFAALALLALAACRDRPAPAPAPSAQPAEPEPEASARRPTRRYYLTRTTQQRCEVTRVDGATITEPFVTPCPPDLEVGEHIRIAGMICMREGGAAERVIPVVCPDPLTNKEKRDLGLFK